MVENDLPAGEVPIESNPWVRDQQVTVVSRCPIPPDGPFPWKKQEGKSPDIHTLPRKDWNTECALPYES